MSTSDEELARRLQEEEYRAQQEILQRQRAADEEYARQLARQLELQDNAQINNSASRRTSAPVRIRLRHPHTENEIGEVMLLHMIDGANTVAFEMENQRGKYLCLKNEFTVEFTRPTDGSHHFLVEKAANHKVRLLPKRYVNAPNSSGSIGWCLSLDGGNGRLIPNAPRCVTVEWLLINADTNSVYQYAGTAGSPAGMISTNQPIHLQPGQPMVIRLKNPLSGHLIQDPLRAHRINEVVMMFELVRADGVYLVVNDRGDLEYMPIMDESAKFIIESLPSGRILLSCMAHSTKRNSNGTSGWYLALDGGGRAVGNAARTGAAEWIMVAAETTSIQGTIVGTSNNSATPTDMSASPNPLVQAAALPPTNTTSAAVVTPPPPPAAASTSGSTTIFTSPVETQLQWLASSTGQLFLSRQPDLLRMYQDGTLKNVLHRSDWPKSALKWRDYSAATIPYEAVVASSWLTDSMRSEFFSSGVMKISNCIPGAILKEATKTVNHFLQSNTNKPDASGRIILPILSKDFTLLQLFYETPLNMMCQRVLGEGQVAPPLECEVSVKFPQLGEPTSQQLGGKRWCVDGFTSTPASPSPYSMLLVVPLSEQDSSFEGNFCIFPQSHEAIHEAIKAQVTSGTFGAEIKDEMNTTKPDLGEPQQLCMTPGDAVMLHSKMAHREAPNYSEKVYFRISHKHHQQQMQACGEDLWAEFDVPPPDYFA